MIQLEIACPNCGSPDQQKISATKFQCGSCRSVWFTEGPETPPPPETPEFQEEQVMVVKPPSIKAGQYLLAKGFLCGMQYPGTELANWWYMDVYEKQPPLATKGFLGKLKMVAQYPLHIARFVFDDIWGTGNGASPNHWILEYHGEERTEQITALAHELAAEFDVKIFVVLESA
jgi:hypothetical protein